ncbi:MAG: T9SS type A sorting domain-containing protein [Saprospiraceae bacterium]|nr:T9SS type A sorting domain-containing protein [Saprospiraceae bacterium]
MRNFFPALIVSMLLPSLLAAQSTPRLFCGNELFSEMVATQYPEWAQSIEKTFEQAKLTQAGQRTTLTIPVVVHVVWNLPEENLSDELIEAQIQVLNEDFNRMNADTGNLRSMFEWVAGSADIEFELVTILRRETSTLFNVDILSGNIIPEVKHTDDGGSDAFYTGNFLNIWVCNIQPLKIGPIVIGQILGFAFPPAGLDNWPSGSNAPNEEEDGVVIDYRVFGPDNPTPVEIPGGTGNLVVKGRTPTHEVAHYLGLRHIWGDGGTFGPNDCAQSDGVDDTPYADSESAFDCDITKNSCIGIEPFYGLDMPDLIENFMDYSSEDCMNMFTKGQVQIMRNVLMGPRSGLLQMTALDDIAASGTMMSLMPNPTSGSVHIQFDQATTVESLLTVADPYGRAVFKQIIAAGATLTTLDLQGLSDGLHAVVLENNQGVQVEKLLIQR